LILITQSALKSIILLNYLGNEGLSDMFTALRAERSFHAATPDEAWRLVFPDIADAISGKKFFHQAFYHLAAPNWAGSDPGLDEALTESKPRNSEIPDLSQRITC
jgi:hypothetical protein